MSIASYGSNAHNKAKIEISYDGGATYSQTETTVVTTGTTYINGGPITLSSVSSQVVLRISNNGISGRGVRLKNLVFTATGASGPAIVVNPATLTGFTYVNGSGPSAEQTFTVSGSNLTEDISIAATANYEISTGTGGSFVATNPIVLTESSGTVSSTTIYVRLEAGLGVGSYNEVVTASSAGATDKTVTCSGSVTIPGAGGGLEDFTNSNATSSYTDGSFVGNNGITWTYVASRDENGDANGSGIDGKALMLRRIADNSAVSSSTISGGIGNFSVKLYKGFTGGGNRQVELFVNGISQGTSTVFDDLVEHNFVVNGINISGDIVIEIRNITSNQVIVDDISWTAYSGGSGVDAPTLFSATANSQNQIDLTWSENATGNDVLIAWSSDGIFGDPVDGTTYASSATIPGGGTSLGTDPDEAFSHTGLSSNTQYFYKIWSVDASTNYSTGVEANATTFATEPSAHPTGFSATANSSSEITVNWTDATPAADGYLIKGSSVGYGDIATPVDGTAETNSLLVQNVASGVQTFQFTGLAASTTYYFKIYPYNGSGTTINYKTDETVQQDDATTNAYSGTLLLISEVADPINHEGRFVEIYNPGATNVNFDSETWYLARQANGVDSWGDIQLTGTLFAGGSYVVASGADFLDFYVAYGLAPDISSGFISGNGDDGYFLYSGGDHATGTLIDAYGVVNEDGSGKPWEYENSKAVRKNTITTPNTTWTASEWNIIPNCDINRMTPYLHPATAWNGNAAKNNDWATGGNWDNGLPGALISAKVPANLNNYPTITSPSEVFVLWLADSTTLVGGENLTINALTFFEKEIIGYSEVDAKDGWYAIAPPVVSEIATSSFVPIETEDDFYVYDETTNYWLNYYDESNPTTLFDNFDPGTGYLVAYAPANAGLLIASGSLNAATSYSPTLTNSNTAWNLIGNPYPSKVNWADVTNTDVSSPKVLDATSGAWEDMGTEIGVGQGIFVYAESGSSLLTFETADQSHGSTKKSGEANGFVKLLAGFDDDLSVQVLLQANQDASQNYEWKYDARYFYPVTSIPYLCAITNDDVWVSKYVFDNGNETTIIPIRFTVSEEQSISFSIDSHLSESGISKLTLEDTYVNKFVELSNNQEYTFTASPDDDALRFKLHAEAATSIHEATIEGLNIYTHANSLYLNSSKAAKAQVEIYNVTGQKVYAENLLMDGLMQITPQLTTGWYITKVTTAAGVATQKVFIKSN